MSKVHRLSLYGSTPIGGNGEKLFIKSFGIYNTIHYIYRNNLKFIVMIVHIYGIVNPITKKVVYVGQTPDNLEHYLKTKYWKLNEVKRGSRNWTKLFHFLDDLLPTKAEIILLKECNTEKPFNSPNGMEYLYIKKYREINPNLLNETDGGIGGYTAAYKSKEDKRKISEKISKANKGRKKPDGFAEHLSAIRQGKNNPMATEIKIGIYNKKDELIHVCNYGFEVNKFLCSKWFWSNNGKHIKNGITIFKFGYKIKRIV